MNKNTNRNKNSHLEPFAEIKLTADWVINQKILRPFAFHPALVDEISAIHDGKGFAHVVIGYKNRQTGFAEIHDYLLNVINRDRVHAAKRLVQHQQFRFGDERTGYG